MVAMPMEVPVNLPDATGSEISKMAVSKLRIRISQFVNQTAMKFEWLYLYLQVPAI